MGGRSEHFGQSYQYLICFSTKGKTIYPANPKCLDTPMGTKEESRFEMTSIYPNPVLKDKELTVSCPKINYKISISTIDGKLIWEKDKLNGSFIFSSSFLLDGLYMININSGEFNKSSLLVVTN